jgi:hypothetical protein
MTASFAALSRLQPARPALAAPAASGRPVWRVLSPNDARIFSALAARMVFSGDPEMPAFADTDAVAIVDTALLQVPEEQSRQLHYGLLAFEYMPIVMIRRFSRFTRLSEADQDRYLSAWAASEWEVCRQGFEAFKNLSMLGYYADEKTWKGIHYGGPWVPRPRRRVA